MLIASLFAVVFGFLQVMPIEAVQDTLPAPAMADTTGQVPGMAEEEEEVIPDTVHVWNYNFPESFEMSETDSTLRWVNLLNLFNKFHSERGAITYRTGTLGRMDGILLHSFETRHMNLELEGLDLNDPLTGNVNWNRLPIHKISRFYEASYGASYRSRAILRDHYLVQPRTYLNFDESKYDHRSLEFSFTQNFQKRTNLELSFWDRRDGGGYRRRAVVGKQAVVRGYHQLNNRWLLKFGYINNGMDREEPFGYSITDPVFFPFNTFVANPIQTNASSNQTSNDVYVQMHHRADTLSNVSTIFGLHYQTSKWSLEYNADTLATNFSNFELFARQRLSFGSTEIYGTVRGFVLNEKEKSNLAETSWIGGEVSIDATQKISRLFELNGFLSTEYWDDGRESVEYSGRLIFSPIQRIRLSGFAGTLSKAPDNQSLYWQSEEYVGSSDLLNEESNFLGAQAEIDFLKTLTLGVRADIRETTNAVFVHEDLFQNIDPYTITSGTAWLSLNSRIFEGEVSGTYKEYSSDSIHPVNQTLASSGERIWIKSNFYWKNYLFDRATFVKAGLSGIYSLNPFRTAEFITPLNRWQHGTNEFINPSYYRLDVDVSARIRWFMVLLKWENVLDQVEQLGYFESVGHPMPGRRFRFGIRVLFTN
ncbi:putative porin [Rhodohalobacter sp. 614A]|uniref:putative porin n=1 Tax=Rhodohalobacter sp. 614A TaxID=2908649 RepID=UPI001F3ABE50|nr:putative porin [Rhodohalobacter sp. 614A]